MPKVKTDTGKGRRRQNTTGDQGRLHPGEVVQGVISDHDYSHMTYTVNLRGQAVTGAVDMSGVFSALLGFKSVQRLAPGTLVVVVYGQPCWIIATGSEDTPDMRSFQSRILTGTGVKNVMGQTNTGEGPVPGHNHPDDLYQGEFEISNLMGTFIRFMTFMAAIGSGERAKVECHLLRDLVRIISRNFEHFSSAGDFKIFDDGRPNMEMNGTTYHHERWGLTGENEAKFQANGTDIPEDIDPLETGRWRYTFLLGFIGDLFNMWFTDPMQAVGKMAEDAFRSGKARLHIGQDGTVLIQSCADIVLERVCRIPVPIRIKHEEDPKGVLRKDMKKLDKKYLKAWKLKEEDEHHHIFKLREYVRYLNQYHSLARLHQMAEAGGKDWKIPSEEETPAPEIGAQEKDRKEANSDFTYWKDCYATIRIFRDGSILFVDAYGNATASGPYGVQISSTRHIHMYAAGDIVQKAGGSIFMSARRHVEAVASRGSLLLKGRTGLRALCEVGTLWLKSDFDPDSPYTPDDGDPEAEVVEKQGIRVQAVRSESRWISKLKARFLVTKKGERMEIVSKGIMRLKTDEDLEIETKKNVLMKISASIKTSAKASYNWFVEGFIIDQVCKLKPGSSELNAVEVSSLKAHFDIGGPKRFGMVEEGKCCYRSHTNHISVFEPDEPIDLSTDEEKPDLEKLEEDKGSDWKLTPKDEYEWDNPGLAGEKEDFDFEPMAQQHIRLADEGTENYSDWDSMTDELLKAPETAKDTPWPGKDFRWKQHEPSKPSLNEPSAEAADTYSADIETALKSKKPTFKCLKK